MRSANQAKASRENGAQSKGPVSPEGKLKVAQNALKHGLTAKHVVLTTENEAAFNEMQKVFYDRFQPADDAEWYLAEEIGVATWKIRQAWSIQQQFMDIQIAANAAQQNYKDLEKVPGESQTAIAEATQANNNKALQNIRLQEDRLSRQRDRLINQLRKLQKDRREAEPTPPEPLETAKPEQKNKPETLFMVATNAPQPASQSIEKEVGETLPQGSVTQTIK